MKVKLLKKIRNQHCYHFEKDEKGIESIVVMDKLNYYKGRYTSIVALIVDLTKYLDHWEIAFAWRSKKEHIARKKEYDEHLIKYHTNGNK